MASGALIYLRFERLVMCSVYVTPYFGGECMSQRDFIRVQAIIYIYMKRECVC